MRSSRAVSDNDSRQGFHSRVSRMPLIAKPPQWPAHPHPKSDPTPPPCSPLYPIFPPSLSWFSPFSPKQMKVVIS